MTEFDPFDGALLVDKPAGPTSHDIVDAIRSHLDLKKVGHCGTLDPNATGLLVIVMGKATRLAERFTGSDKVYEGVLRLGVSTDSHDAEGQVLETREVPELNLDLLNLTAERFEGDQMQTPPMVSAVKVNGVPLYKLARQGQEVERKARLVHIYRYQFTHYEAPWGCFKCACTKGTYVRVLVHELGELLGCGAHLHTLRRTGSGMFDVRDAVLFEDLLAMSRPAIQARVIPFLRLTRME